MSKILTSLHGKMLGLDYKGRLIAPKGVLHGDDGNQVSINGPTRVSWNEDFIGATTLPATVAFVEGSDGATSTAALLVGGIGGVCRFTTGDVTGVTAGNVLSNVEQLVQSLCWQASNGDLIFQARLKLSSITTSFAFLGFTDLITAELPIEGSGTADGITTNATDAVGFLFDVRMTTKKWWLVGVANDVDATAQNSGVAPVADKYQTFRVELSVPPGGATNATAKFFINGLQVGTAMSNALVSATDLTPTVAISKAFADTTSITADLDYIHVAMDRGLDGTAT